MEVRITGSLPKGSIKIGDIDFGKFGPEDHKRFSREFAPHNYHQIPGWVVDGVGKEDCTLLLKRQREGRVEGKQVLDFQAMYSVHNFGYKEIYNHIVHDVVEYLIYQRAPKAIPRAQDHKYHSPAIEAVRQSTGLDCVLMKSGGVETVETACNIASKFWYKTHNQRGQNFNVFIVAQNNFHGRSNRARSFSSSPSAREGYGPFLSNVHHVKYGNIDHLKTALELYRGNAVAFIVELVQGEGGVFVPPHDYIPSAKELCEKYGTLFIADEIQTGFGRTGRDWAYEHYDILPDLLCAGKAAGGGILPVSFVAGRKVIMSCIDPGTEGATWSAAPIQCVALVAAIRELSLNKLSQKSADKGDAFLAYLNKVRERFPNLITDIRGQGLFVGIDTVFDAQKFSEVLLEKGVWAKETGVTREDGTMKTIRFSPPLTISDTQLQNCAHAFESVLKIFKNRA